MHTYILPLLYLFLSNIHCHDGAARSWAWTWVAWDDKSAYCKKDFEGERTTLSYTYCTYFVGGVKTTHHSLTWLVMKIV